MNKKAILELADHMERIRPSSFDMGCFNSDEGAEQLKRKVTLHHRCGTTCCIAGEKVLLDGGFYSKGSFFVNDRPVWPDLYAMRALKLPNRDVFFDYSIKTPKQAAAALRALAGAK